jgi:predicted RecB family nuclease
MHKHQGQIRFSASDLVNFLGCRHATFLDLRQLAAPIKLAEDDSTRKLLQQKGLEHERRYLETLRAEGRSIAEIPDKIELQERVALTRKAMEEGVDVIYQGVLVGPPWLGYADFLIRADGIKSKFGDYAYEIADTKLAHTAKPKHVIQLCVYADLLAAEQDAVPKRLHVVLGSGTTESLETNDFIHYFGVARDRFREFVDNPPTSYEPEPCAHCEFCRWSEHCKAHWEEIDHLSRVANISSANIDRLAGAGISTLAQLASAPIDLKVPRLQAETYTRLRAQAALQRLKQKTGTDEVEILPLAEARGFARLPQPDPGDIFFDMEGDPLFEGGLEYLFGLVHIEGSDEIFTPFWGHDRDAEKRAFEATIDFMVDRFADYPDAHVYHYAAYEAMALKNLAMRHGTREFAVDQMLRKGKLVDLYKAVREGIRVSEPRYSIKNLETFYWKGKRNDEITSAGQSVVIYEEWRQTKEDKLLEDIRRYNEVDCRSTLACRDWLLTLRPPETAWFTGPSVTPTDTDKEAERLEAEKRAQEAIAKLVAGAPEAELPWRRTLGHLLEFHRRAAKPGWWAAFERSEMAEDALIEDAECIGGLRAAKDIAPYPEKQSLVYTFRFPPQDFKMRVGGKPLRADTLKPTGEIFDLDEKKGLISLKIGKRSATPPEAFALIPEAPINDKVIRAAIQRCADAVSSNAKGYTAVRDILRKVLPRLHGCSRGDDILSSKKGLLAGAIEAIQSLNDSYLLVQGPPGTGKTFTSAHAIVALLKDGKRVGVSSNSHKAINNLLKEVERVAVEQRVKFAGVKKSSEDDDSSLESGGQIVDVYDNELAADPKYQLVAGTAWLLARDEFDKTLDYLFIDEAGQVSLANVVALGTSARNIVLVGDQMQLAQPIQGVHPDESGLSALDYLLGDHATVPPDLGVFLSVTRRMHPDVCRFVSESFYEARLNSDATTNGQKIVDSPRLTALSLPATGIQFFPVAHDGCSQRCEAEVDRIAHLFSGLIGQAWVDQTDKQRKIGIDDILVVSPYNMQVALLENRLPSGARVGTVDKFQGQEAAVVLVSMATSSAEEMPRNIEFLFSRNRLNVAISRARCLSIIVASPRLLEVPCITLKQMQLVNSLCHFARLAAS